MRQGNPMIVYYFAFEAALLEPHEIHRAIKRLRLKEERPENATTDFNAVMHRQKHLAVVTHFTAVEVMP